MTESERHSRAKTIFLEALAKPEGERDGFVVAASEGDSELLQDVRGLLEHAEPAETGSWTSARDSSGVSLRSGEMFAERFRVVSHLGSGAMGDVYRAVDTTLDVDVALKILRERSPNLVAQLLDEVRLARSVTHPAICRVYDVGDRDGTYFFTMEFVDGEDLASLLARIGRVPSAKTREIAVQLCDGLQAAHERGILHRDIKPTNIMLDAAGQVRITDFGVATVDGARHLELPAGTPAYMAPEQLIDGAPASVATDLYAVGLVLYEAVTARCASGDAPDVAAARAAESFARPSELVADVDPALELAILELLRADPKRRPASAADIANRLRDDVPARAVTRGDTTKAALLQWRIAGGVMFALAVALGWLWIRPAHEPAMARTVLEEMRISSGNAVGTAVVVLPTFDATAGAAPAYLAEGIQDGIIDLLSRVSGIRVIAEESADSFTGEADPALVRAALGADFAAYSRLEGDANTIRVVVLLRNTQNGESVWSAERECAPTPDAMFGFEHAAVDGIAKALHGVGVAIAHAVSKPPTYDHTAYGLYLRGREHVPPFRRAEFEPAVDYLKRAIEKDPGLAQAYAGIGTAYTIASIRGWIEPAEGFATARRYATRALEIDDALDEAHVVVATIAGEYDWEWTRAERGFVRALEINPNSEIAWRVYARFLSAQLRFDEALPAAQRALELNPASAVTVRGGAERYYEARDYERAIELARAAIRLDPLYPASYETLGMSLVELERYDEGLENLRKAVTLAGRDAGSLAWLGYGTWKAGRQDEAREIVAEAHELGDPDGVEGALLALSVNDEDSALSALASAVARHARPSMWLAVSPVFDPLRPRPEFQALLSRVGLPTE